MRRPDIQLLARARQGGLAARYEVGRRYLLGTEGFPLHLELGLEYLLHPSVRGSAQAATVIAESMSLHDLVRFQQLDALRLAANCASVAAQLKLGLWTCIGSGSTTETRKWFELAADAGNSAAKAALVAMKQSRDRPYVGVVQALAGEPGICASALVAQALSSALFEGEEDRLARALDCALVVAQETTPELADAVCAALIRAQSLPRFRFTGGSERIELLLEDCVRRGDSNAALLFGRALCGLSSGPLPATSLTKGQSLRKGAALLLRAADAGKQDAWMLLYRLHSDNRASVANPPMARFFLEKAAIGGDVKAQLRLGALILRSATTLHDSEQGIYWLHEAAKRQDQHAIVLLRSLVLPVAGSEIEATGVIDAMRRDDPWTSCRLRTARDFGLTKLEALSVDIVAGYRPWGLVVGPNPFIHQPKRSAPRAVPAWNEQSAETLRRSVAFLAESRQGGAPVEGDLRKRSVRLRHLLARYGVEESLFFAEARATVLNTLRQGPKWAFHARQPLRSALAA